tara:strand:+ start:1205 stop:1495 length:291 start_codon:yes stop_codon:yes gene_type:complete
MKCYYHPDATLQHQEVKYKDYTKPQMIHEILGESTTRIQDILYCPKCFEEHANTGTAMEQNLVADHFEYIITPDELRQIENDIGRHVEHQVQERMS